MRWAIKRLAIMVGLVALVPTLSAPPASAFSVADWTVTPSSTWRTGDASFIDWDFPDWCPGPTGLSARITFRYRATASRVQITRVRITNTTSGVTLAGTLKVNGASVSAYPAAGRWSNGVTKTLYRAPTSTIASFSNPWTRTVSGRYMTGFDVEMPTTTGGSGCAGGVLLRFARR